MRVGKRQFAGALILLGACLPGFAQTVQFFPEIDTYVRLTSAIRGYGQVKETRQGGDPTQWEIGPSIDYFVKPLARLRHITTYDLDDRKTRLMVLSIGYRYLPEGDHAPATNRIEPVMTFHAPITGRLLLTDRNRADLDWKAGRFVWRYRNRIEIERTVALRSYHFSPYASAEFYYLSQYEKWSTTALYAGCLLPVRKHFEFNPYYEHENNTGRAPNQQVNGLGLMLNLFFSVRPT